MKHIAIIFLTILICASCTDDTIKEENTASTNNTLTASIPTSIQNAIDIAKKDSNNIDVQLKTVATLDSANYYKQALVILDKVIATDSLNNTYWLKRGQLCNKLQDTIAAIKAFGYAAKIYATPLVLMELANDLAQTKNVKALTICDDLIKQNPSGDYTARANYFKAIYYQKINEQQKAITILNDCIARDFHFAEPFIDKGYILYHQKKYSEALNVFKQLTTFNQTNADGYYWQAKCYEAINNKDEALNLYTKSLQLDETIVEAKQAIERLKK